MMSAAHCGVVKGAKFKSAVDGTGLTVKKIIEQDGALDYFVALVEWDGAMPSAQRHTQRLITSKEDVQVAAAADDALYAVGYPGDKTTTWGATFSAGKLREATDTTIKFDVGIINGNSGGALRRQSDDALVGLTNNGRKNFGEDGWDKADVDNSVHWNSGSASWAIYAKSAVLQRLFPGGVFDAAAEAALLAEGGGAEFVPPPTETYTSFVATYVVPSAASPASVALQLVPTGSGADDGCEDYGMQVTAIGISTWQKLSLQTARRGACAQDVKDRFVDYQLTLVGTDACGARRYTGKSVRHQSQSGFDAGLPLIDESSLPDSTIEVVDASGTECDVEAKFVATETFGETTVKLYANALTGGPA
jgi:hypothetical protein